MLKEVYAKMEGNRTSAFELEAVGLASEGIGQSLGVLKGKCQIINAEGNILIDIAILVEPDVRLGLAGLENKILEAFKQTFMPALTTALEFIEGLLDDENVILSFSKLRSTYDVNLLGGM